MNNKQSWMSSGLKLSENIPDTITAYLDVKDGKHVWCLWKQLNTKLKQSGVRRHDFYSISNWEFLHKQPDGNSRPSRKRKQ